MTRQVPRLVAALLGALWLVLALATPASAHAQLVGTDPSDGDLLQQAPSEVTLSFNEPVRLTAQEITLYDAEGQPVPTSARTSDTDVVVEIDDPDALGTGTFVVGWFVVSADGHPISGSLTFSVGERSAEVAGIPPAPTSSGVVRTVQGVVNAATYVGLLVATGLAGFVALVLPASWGGEQVRGRIRRVTRGAAGLGVAGALLGVPLAAVYAQGLELTDVVPGFDAGLVVDELMMTALIAGGLALVVLALPPRAPDQRQRTAMLAGAALALAGPPLVGHTRSYQPAALLISSDLVHLLAGAAWLGGLLGLVLALRELAGREQVAATTLARFSTIAGGLLLAVAASGTVLAWRILGSWTALPTTGYGQILIVKIALALLVAGLGGWNRFRLLPRVRTAAGYADRGSAAALVTRAVRVEASVLVVLLVLTGFLVSRSPRPAPVEVPEGRSGVQDGSLGDIEVLVLLDPKRQGANTLQVQLQDEAGDPLVTDRPPEVSLRSGEVDLGSVPLASSGAGTWAAEVLIPQPGTWTVDVGLRVSRFENPVTSVTFEVAPR